MSSTRIIYRKCYICLNFSCICHFSCMLLFLPLLDIKLMASASYCTLNNNNLYSRAYAHACILPCISTCTSGCPSAAGVGTDVLCCLPFQLCFFLNLPMAELYRSKHKPSEMWSSAEKVMRICQEHDKKLHLVSLRKNSNGTSMWFILFKQIFDACFNLTSLYGWTCFPDFHPSYCWQTHL